MEDDEARPKRDAHIIGMALDPLSVEELAVRIAGLKDEIARLEYEIEKKNATKSAADSVFKF